MCECQTDCAAARRRETVLAVLPTIVGHQLAGKQLPVDDLPGCDDLNAWAALFREEREAVAYAFVIADAVEQMERTRDETREFDFEVELACS